MVERKQARHTRVIPQAHHRVHEIGPGLAGLVPLATVKPFGLGMLLADPVPYLMQLTSAPRLSLFDDPLPGVRMQPQRLNHFLVGQARTLQGSPQSERAGASGLLCEAGPVTCPPQRQAGMLVGAPLDFRKQELGRRIVAGECWVLPALVGSRFESDQGRAREDCLQVLA